MGASEVRERTGGTQRRPLRTSLRPLSLHVHSLAQRRLSLHIHSGAVGVTVKVTCSLAGAAYHHHKYPTVELDTQHSANTAATVGSLGPSSATVRLRVEIGLTLACCSSLSRPLTPLPSNWHPGDSDA